LRPGEPLLVTELTKVFTQPDERAALNKLYNAFFRIPLFVAQYQKEKGAPPSLAVIAQQFSLPTSEDADTLLRVMESDPRVPHFLARDAKSGEITRVDVEAIRNDPRFGQIVARELGGWEGKPAPDFELTSLDGGKVSLAALRGSVVLLEIWFTGCPPCMKETPHLCALTREFEERGCAIVGANADRLLGLSDDDAVRQRYVKQEKIDYRVVHWAQESDQAYGNIAIFPTMFLMDQNGTIVRHWVGYVPPGELRQGIREALSAARARR